MKDLVIVGLPPNCDNIRYHVESLLLIHHLCDMLATRIRTSFKDFPKTSSFVRQLQNAHKCIEHSDEAFTKPRGFPDFHKHRLVDMYTWASSDDMKKKNLESFMTGDGQLRVSITTSAFSMGVDFPDIHNVVHVGPPSSLVQYVQESGRVELEGTENHL